MYPNDELRSARRLRPRFSVRAALDGKGVRVATSAVADFCPESASLADGMDSERHHIVVVDADETAFVGLLERSATTEQFVRWEEVLSGNISDRDEIARRLNENRRAGMEWNAGVDPRYTSPRDVIYNALIQTALSVLRDANEADG